MQLLRCSSPSVNFDGTMQDVELARIMPSDVMCFSMSSNTFFLSSRLSGIHSFSKINANKNNCNTNTSHNSSATFKSGLCYGVGHVLLVVN